MIFSKNLLHKFQASIDYIIWPIKLNFNLYTKFQKFIYFANLIWTLIRVIINLININLIY